VHKGFAFCNPIIQIDGTWLYGKYKGTLLMAVAQDGNNNVFPIALALVKVKRLVGGVSFFDISERMWLHKPISV
jgi:hypothetical protein